MAGTQLTKCTTAVRELAPVTLLQPNCYCQNRHDQQIIRYPTWRQAGRPTQLTTIQRLARGHLPTTQSTMVNTKIWAN